MFLNGITVVLCGNRDKYNGATIAWTTRIERNQALVSLPKHAPVTRELQATGDFTISVLSDCQADIARQYGGHRQANLRPRNLEDLDFKTWKVPVVRGACSQLLCRVKHTLSVEEQVVVIGSVTGEFESDGKPLAYDHCQYFTD